MIENKRGPDNWSVSRKKITARSRKPICVLHARDAFQGRNRELSKKDSFRGFNKETTEMCCGVGARRCATHAEMSIIHLLVNEILGNMKRLFVFLHCSLIIVIG